MSWVSGYLHAVKSSHWMASPTLFVKPNEFS
jgi:hypothetical protein